MEKKVKQKTDDNERYQRFIESIRKLAAEEREKLIDKVFEAMAAEKTGAYRRTR